MTDDTTPKVPRLQAPVDEVRKALERGARTVATLLARRRRYLSKLAALDDELAQERQLLRALIRDVATRRDPGTQLALEDEE